MAATTFASIISDTRATNLIESSARFWADTELAAILKEGCKDLWKEIVDLYEHHFFTLDESNVSIAAGAKVLTGVPTDLYRLVSIEPRVLGDTSPNPGLVFVPRPWNHPDFVRARAQSPVQPNNRQICFTPTNAGPPIGAPTIRIAPALTDAVLLTLGYNYSLPALDVNSSNPIPGESDNALKAWLTAYAKAKDRDDSAPDPEWLAIYGTEKVNLKMKLAMRQVVEPEIAEAFFQEAWED